MPASRRLAFALIAFALPPAAPAEIAHYALDPVHTRVLFAVSHAGFSQAMGTVSGSHGELWFDPDDWSRAKLTVEVPLDRLDMGDAKWTRAVQAANLLDTAKYPVARFVSKQVEAVDATHARVCGDLAIHGVTRDACMDVAFNQLKRHPLPPFRRTAGFSATATLKRSDFGIDAWKSVIGDEVSVRIEAEALRARGGSDDDTGPDKNDSPPATDNDTPETHP
jgi:polyisoprenoid-binding protein YceI